MIDIHCHILPGVDDGPTVLETSLAMAAIAANDGIRAIVATPHTEGIRVNRESVVASVDRLNNELCRQNIKVEILPGFEIPYHLAGELAPTHTLCSSNFVLIEFPHTHIPGDAVSTLYQLCDKGLQPIIAHPERNMDLLGNPELLAELVDCGAQAQLTASSITGEMGTDIQRFSNLILRKNLAHYVATDSHSPSFRKPVLSKAYKTVTKLIGKNQSDLIFFHNPCQIGPPACGSNKSLRYC